jgi:hypothetical protein
VQDPAEDKNDGSQLEIGQTPELDDENLDPEALTKVKDGSGDPAKTDGDPAEVQKDGLLTGEPEKSAEEVVEVEPEVQVDLVKKGIDEVKPEVE